MELANESLSIGAFELANTVVFGNRVVSPKYFRDELVNFVMNVIEGSSDVFLFQDVNSFAK